MSVKIAINGFGRIGRLAFRQLFDMDGYDIVAINDLTSAEMLAYLLKYDSVQKTYKHAESVHNSERAIYVNNREIAVYNEMNAEKLPWKNHDIDIVLECTGAYLSKQKAQSHLDAGAKKVVLSAPAGKDISTIIYGINEDILTEKDTLVSVASCSTNGLTPMIKVLNDTTPILSGIMTVIHGYTATQMLVDGPQSKGNLRRSRAAAANIIPTTAEAAKAVTQVLPELEGKLTGSAVRVPVPCGCLVTLTAVVLGTEVTEATINAAMKAASSEVFGYTEEEYVSTDIIGITFASLFDASQTLVNMVDDTMFEVRVAAWFDNENSFASQIVRTVKHIAQYARYI